MSDFFDALRALVPTTAVYMKVFDGPFEQMTPGQAAAALEGYRGAFRDEAAHPESSLATALSELGVQNPIIWRVTRGEPVATVVWESQ